MIKIHDSSYKHSDILDKLFSKVTYYKECVGSIFNDVRYKHYLFSLAESHYNHYKTIVKKTNNIKKLHDDSHPNADQLDKLYNDMVLRYQI